MSITDHEPGVAGRPGPLGREERARPIVGPVPVPARTRRQRVSLAAKRVFDLVIASVTVVLLLPVFLVIAVAILVAEGRPVLYHQQRVGRYGRPFTMLKFRSMVPDAHDQLQELREHNERTGPLFKIHKDPRVTGVGNFLRFTSLDELPQLFNVLGGTMSLVGPRPRSTRSVRASRRRCSSARSCRRASPACGRSKRGPTPTSTATTSSIWSTCTTARCGSTRSCSRARRS